MSELGVVLIAAFLVSTTAGADSLSDPMRPFKRQIQIERSLSGQGFSLSAILYSTDRRIAIVNGQPVAEGQRVNGAVVRRIHRGKVELEVDGQLLKLELTSDRHTK